MILRKTVLLADAGEEFRAMLRDAMEATDEFSVETAANGLEVLERVRAHTPDLLVMDLALPGMDGISVLRTLRSEGYAPLTFLTSAFVSDYVLSEASELKAAYFLPKPFAFESLFSKMHHLIHAPMRNAQHPPSPRHAALILHELGMLPGLKGYRYAHDAILLALDEPNLRRLSQRSSIPVSPGATARRRPVSSAPSATPSKSRGSAAIPPPGSVTSAAPAGTEQSRATAFFSPSSQIC